jgi:hypothetical protein
MKDLEKVWAYTPGAETPDKADEVVVVDAGDVVQGLGVAGLRRVRRVRRVVVAC